MSAHTQLVNEVIWQRAEELESDGLKAVDALHMACAEAASADYFVTCDDRLISRYQSIRRRKIEVCNPTEFVHTVVGE